MLPDRFWSKATITPDCWPWKHGTDQSGYGMFWLDGATRRAPRVAYQLAIGRIPDGMIVRHTCDNPPCVNPDHLILGTNADNSNDAAVRGRLATGDRNGSRLYPERLRRGHKPGGCRNGHHPSKRYISKSGEARCTECQRLRRARYVEALSCPR